MHADVACKPRPRWIVAVAVLTQEVGHVRRSMCLAGLEPVECHLSSLPRPDRRNLGLVLEAPWKIDRGCRAGWRCIAASRCVMVIALEMAPTPSLRLPTQSRPAVSITTAGFPVRNEIARIEMRIAAQLAIATLAELRQHMAEHLDRLIAGRGPLQHDRNRSPVMSPSSFSSAGEYRLVADGDPMLVEPDLAAPCPEGFVDDHLMGLARLRDDECVARSVAPSG